MAGCYQKRTKSSTPNRCCLLRGSYSFLRASAALLQFEGKQAGAFQSKLELNFLSRQVGHMA
jgi:hypothetical protein